MNAIKRISGLLWLAAAALAMYLMLRQAASEFGRSPALDTRIFWWTIIPIFTPIMLGLALFGVYCLKGEYNSTVEK